MTTSLAPPLLVWSLHFASSDGGLVDAGQTGQWEWGAVVAGPVSPGSVWATNLSGPYLHDTEDWLLVDLPDTGDLALPSLVVTHWYSVRDGDSAVVEVDSGNGTFVRVEPAYGYPSPDGYVGESLVYVDAVFDLSAFGPTPQVRLKLTSDAGQASLGWYVSDLALWDGDVLPPIVTVAAPPVDTQDLAGPYVVEAQVVDDHAGVGTTLYYTVNGGAPVAVAMKGVPATAAIPAQPPDTAIALWVEASDGQNMGRWPETGVHEFRVFLAAPIGLVAELPLIRPVTDHVTLTWRAPVSPHIIENYRIVREGSVDALVETPLLSGTVPLEPDDPGRFQVYAEYDVGLSDPSEVVAIDVEVPVLDSVVPSAALPGQDLFVHLTGRSLYMLDGVTKIELGMDVEVLEVDVFDVGEAVVAAHVGFGAAPGARDVTVSGAMGTFVFDGAFTVLDPSSAARIVGVVPDTLVAGTTETLVVESTMPFASTVRVLVDTDFEVVGPLEVDGVNLSIPLSAAVDAAPGPHTIAIEDGDVLHTVVVEVVPAVSGLRTCAVGPAPAAWGGLFLLGLVRARRPRR